MRNLTTDVRYAARALLAQRSFTVAAALTLALGIGMTTAIFGVVNGVVLRPLPLPNADRLISICEEHPGATPDWCSISPPNVEDIARRARSIDAIGIGRSWSTTLTTPDGAADNLSAGIASPGMFTALGFRAELGRLLLPEDLLGRQSTVALITHEMWQSRFGGDSGIVGRTLVLDGAPVSIVGVIEPDIRVPLFEWVELWRPLHIDPRDEGRRSWRGFVAYGRLREGTSLAEASAELAGIERDLRAAHFAETERWGLRARPLQDLIVGNVRGPMMLFLGAVFLVLIVACVNVANLILARGAARGREIAVRAALGASRGRIVRALLVESALLSLTGGALGLLLAHWAADLFKWGAPAWIPRVQEVAIDSHVLGFALAVTILTTVLFGLVPALRLSRVNLSESLREGGRTGTGRSRLGRALVVAELAISLSLVAGAALLARSFATLTAWDPGFERAHLTTFSVFLPSTAYARRADIGDIWERIEREVAGIPGVSSVSTASAGPLFGSRETWEMRVEGRGVADLASIRWYDVSPGFFATLGVPIVLGRDFGPDDRFGVPSTALINETLARRYWLGENPIGKSIVFPANNTSETFTVIGVVRDVPPMRVGTAIEPEIYWSNRQAPRPFTYFLVRTDIPPSRIADAVAARVKSANPNFEARGFATYRELLARDLRAPRFNMLLLGVFGLAALLLAGIGTYGMLAYFVEQRTRDIGIRLALGAGRGQVVAAVMRSGLSLAILGIGLGMVGALVLGKAIGAMLVGVSPSDPVMLGASAAAVLVVAAFACLLPAWRASHVDPAMSLIAD